MRQLKIHLVIILTIIMLAQPTPSYDFDKRKLMPGDVVFSQISVDVEGEKGYFNYSEIMALQRNTKVKTILPIMYIKSAVETVKNPFASEIVPTFVIDFKIFRELSSSFNWRSYQPFQIEEIWRKSENTTNGVIVTGSFASQYGIALGDVINLDTLFSIRLKPLLQQKFSVKVIGIVSEIKLAGYNIYTSSQIYFPYALFQEKLPYGQNMTNGFALKFTDGIDNAEKAASVIKELENQIAESFEFDKASLFTTASFDPKRTIEIENKWGFSSNELIYMTSVVRLNNFFNHLILFGIVLPTIFVSETDINRITLQLLNLRGLKKKEFIDKYIKTTRTWIIMSGIGLLFLYAAIRTMMLIKEYTFLPPYPWLFELNLLKSAGWIGIFLGVSILGFQRKVKSFGCEENE